MSKKLRNLVLTFLAIHVIAWFVAQLVSKRLDRGDEDSDEFRVAALLGGRSFQRRRDPGQHQPLSGRLLRRGLYRFALPGQRWFGRRHYRHDCWAG